MSSTSPSAVPPVASSPFLTDVLEGLNRPQKTLPSKYFYDAAGSKLFDQITELEEYYPTRTEVAIMNRYIDEMGEELGARCVLVEYGSGSSYKTRILLDHLPDLAAYVPIDISAAYLAEVVEALEVAYPNLNVLPVAADYTADFTLPTVQGPVGRTVVYFPGSTIGNFEPSSAEAFLRHIAEVTGERGGVLIGVDLQKDRSVLEAAYNDAAGVTAAFNKNVLTRINRELGADFRPERFEHRAVYDAELGRIEMHLVSLAAQRVRIGGQAFDFTAGETIHTENSYKYTLQGFAALAERAGFHVQHVWTDDQDRFSVQFLTVKSEHDA